MDSTRDADISPLISLNECLGENVSFEIDQSFATLRSIEVPALEE